MLKEFVLAGPQYFCAVEYVAHRRTLELIWNDDISNPNSAYNRRPGQTIRQRLEPLSLLKHAEGVDANAFDYWFGCIELGAHSVDIEDGMIELVPEHDKLKNHLAPQERDYPKLSGIMTVNQAATLGFWES